MSSQVFKIMTHKEKQAYLRELFSTINKRFPIYTKTYDLLVNHELDDDELDDIYDAVQGIQELRKTKDGETIRKMQDIVKQREQEDRKDTKKELEDIENILSD
ncbi:MAG: hypothetical protein WCJ45_01990 [bacterium]